MKKVKSGKIKLKDIKHVENSRFREIDDVGDLMHDIEQRGLLQNVGVRIKDNALIYGNRRVKAFEKLGLNEIPCDFYDDMSDEDLLITNLIENLQIKSIGAIEIGRICKILQEKGLTNYEIASKLHVAKTKVESCVSAYNITIGTPFETLVTYGITKSKLKGIPVSLIWKIQNDVGHHRKLTTEDWMMLLTEISTGNMTAEHISKLRCIVKANTDIRTRDAIKLALSCEIIHTAIPVNPKRLQLLMDREQIANKLEFVRHVLKEYDKDLLM